MASNWILHAGMALALGGFFAATWWATRRPATRRSRERIDPPLEPGIRPAADSGAERRVPTL